MLPVRRLPFLVLALAVLSAACGGGPGPAAPPSPSPGSPATVSQGSVPPSSVPSPSPTPNGVTLPTGIPSEFAQALPAVQVPTGALVPAGSKVTGTWLVPAAAGIGAQIVVTWSTGTDPFRQAHGLAVWQSFSGAPPWRAVYGFADPVSRGVYGIRAQIGDLTADAHPDVLTFEDTGGSGTCGVWRVLATQAGAVTELYHWHTCDTNIVLSNGTLVETESVYAPGDAHCCPSATRTTTLQWDGTTWRVASSVLRPSPSP